MTDPLRILTKAGVEQLISDSGLSASIRIGAYQQDTPADNWLVEHDFGAEPQVVNVFDADGNQLLAHPFHVSLNAFEIHHNVARSGHVEYLRFDD